MATASGRPPRHRRRGRRRPTDAPTASPARRSGLASAPDRPAGAGPAGPVQRALAELPGQRGARAADRQPPGQPPQGRHPAAAARLRHGRALALRAVPQVRRPVHHPPAGGRDHPGQPGHGHHHAGRRAAARHDRGHRLHARPDADRLRRRGGAAGRRRDQARPGQAGRRGQGRDDPQDGRRDGQGPAGAGDQAGRPAAQHAHADLPAPRPSRSRRPRRRWRSWPRWRTASA